MKLSKDYFADSKNGKYIPKGQTQNKLDQICVNLFGERLQGGKLFVIDNDLDMRWFKKFDDQVSDWEKSKIANVWYSSFNKAIKFNNVADKTVYIIYRESK